MYCELIGLYLVQKSDQNAISNCSFTTAPTISSFAVTQARNCPIDENGANKYAKGYWIPPYTIDVKRPPHPQQSGAHAEKASMILANNFVRTIVIPNFF